MGERTSRDTHHTVEEAQIGKMMEGSPPITTMKFIQIKFSHRKAATAILCEKITLGTVDIAPIQEPWVHEHQIRGLSCCVEQYFLLHSRILQDPVFMSGIKLSALPLLQLYSRDVKILKIT